MATTIGTVTRTMGDTIANATETAQGNCAAFVARGAAGVVVGHFRSAGEAQNAVAKLTGKILNWVRSDLRGGIEHYVGSLN